MTALREYQRSIALIIVVCLTGASSQAKELSITLHRQNSPVWCWAAAAAMVISYVQKFSVEDCEVLSEYDIRLGGRGLCCVGAGECQRGGLGLEEIGRVLGNVFSVHGRYGYDPLDFDEVKEQIDDDHPVIAAIDNGDGSGHAVVIAGYRGEDTLIILDPIEGRHSESYDHFHRRWAGTIKISTDTADADNPGCRRVREQIGLYVRTRAVCRER